MKQEPIFLKIRPYYVVYEDDGTTMSFSTLDEISNEYNINKSAVFRLVNGIPVKNITITIITTIKITT